MQLMRLSSSPTTSGWVEFETLDPAHRARKSENTSRDFDSRLKVARAGQLLLIPSLKMLMSSAGKFWS